MTLRRYRQKRHFERTTEPRAGRPEGGSGRIYVIQKHAARSLHYDLRLELGGVLKSWAVPKGPSLDPSRKRLAVHVEDHPVEYADFEGIIPEGEYGGGTVMVWDRGAWEPEGDPDKAYRKGHLKFRLHGEKLKGSWTLARMNSPSDREGKNWLLIKKKDPEARPGHLSDASDMETRSVLTGRTMKEIASREGISRPGVEDLFAVQGAEPAPMPVRPRPHLAVLTKAPPGGDEWLHEIKYDGYRILCIKKDAALRLITRNNKDWSDKFKEVAGAAASLPLDRFILDGEMVVLGPDGKPDFQALQNILRGETSGRPVYYIFDILYGSGYDLTSVPLLERKRILRKLLEGTSQPLVYGDYIRGDGDRVFDHACRMGLEGIVSKQAGSRYEQRRSRSWEKVKCVKRQEFVIGGYSEPSGSRTGLTERGTAVSARAKRRSIHSLRSFVAVLESKLGLSLVDDAYKHSSRYSLIHHIIRPSPLTGENSPRSSPVAIRTRFGITPLRDTQRFAPRHQRDGSMPALGPAETCRVLQRTT